MKFHNLDVHNVEKLERVCCESTLANIYAASDLTLHCSRQDNLPQVAVESVCCGTPVLAFDVGGMRDIVDDEMNGIIEMPFDVSSLAKRTLELFKEKDRLAIMSKYCKLKARERWDSSVIADRYLSLYHSLLK